MPRKRQIQVNEATRATIKETARRLMVVHGTAGLSLRAIARELEMTAPALYHYFPSLDDLITALIVDAFTGHAAYVRQQRDAAATAGKSYREQLFVAMQAYRRWALDHPIDFQLVYGNPIPGYAAPVEVTAPAARSLGGVFMETVMSAVSAGDIAPPTFTDPIPPTVRNHYQRHFGLDGPGAQIFHLMNHVWSLMHGMVTLEIYNHAAPVVGDTDAFYTQAIRHQFHLMGIELP
ncbi:MAG: TetR/AcrR family transcriptional regulator [Caldilineaceae bacterium]